MQHWTKVSALVLVVASGMAACGNTAREPRVARINSTTTTLALSSNAVSSPTSSTGSAGDPRAYAQCMRANGIGDFPDPNASGEFDLRSGPTSDLNPDNPRYLAAQKVCQSLRPVPSGAQQQQMLQQMFKFTQCMRAHGIRDFPNPNTNGEIFISRGQRGDLNPNDPAFQSAQKACQSLVPGGKGGP